MDQSRKQLVQKYEQMVGQDKNVYFDADQIEAIAYSYENKEDFAEALKAVNYGLTLHPGNSSLRLCKAKYLLFLDYIDQAGELINTITENSEEATLVRIEYQFACGNIDQGFEMIDQQLKSGTLNWEFALDVVNILWGYATYQQIIDFIIQALKQLPNNKELITELAAIYQDNQEEEKAIELYNQLLDQDPYQDEIWKELAKTYSLQKNYEKAIEACDFALAINNNNEEILCFKGYCLYDMGDYKNALQSFLDYSLLSKDKTNSYELIADCYTKLEMTSQAISYLKKALKISPDNLQLLYQLAYCYQDMGNTPMAKEILNKGLEIDPNQSEYLTLLGELQMQEENFSDSFETYKKALELDPNNVDILAIMGDLSERMDNMEQAVTFYEQAHLLRPTDVKILFRLLLGYYAINLPDKAFELSTKISHLADQFTKNDPALTPEEKEKIEETQNMIETLKKLLQELLENKD